MLSALRSSTNSGDMGHLDLVTQHLLHVNSSTQYLVHPPYSFMLTAPNSTTDMSVMVHRSAPSVVGTFVEDLPSSYVTMRYNRVATADRHDINAWSQERKVHDTKRHAMSVSSSLGSNGTVPDYYLPVNMAGSSLTPMEFQYKGVQSVEEFLDLGRLHEDTVVHLHEWTPLITPGSDVLPVQANVIINPCSREDLSEGNRRVGENLARCGVPSGLGMSAEPILVGCRRNSCVCPVDGPLISSMTAGPPFGEKDALFITALAEWTSQWVYALIIRPHLQGNFRFQYQEEPNRASASAALRIRRVINEVENPVQVAIYALWFIGTLTGNGTHDNSPFLSIPLFRYLHNNGTFIAEDFMFHTFVACAMIGDKTVNDSTLSTSAWGVLTRVPRVILNATEKYVLNCLKWNIVMTLTQWQDTIIYLRSCIKMGPAFDPFAYDGTSPSGVMARYLDKLIDFSCMLNETYASSQEARAIEILAPQPIRHFTHWDVFDAAEWCPEDDPVVNRKPRIIGIAPGADQNSSTLKVGMTAKDLLDSILRPSDFRDLTHLRVTQSAGTSFCSSFGIIGARLAHTMKITGATCQSASWVPSHG